MFVSDPVFCRATLPHLCCARRVAAMSVAKRVSEEMGVELGQEVREGARGRGNGMVVGGAGRKRGDGGRRRKEEMGVELGREVRGEGKGKRGGVSGEGSVAKRASEETGVELGQEVSGKGRGGCDQPHDQRHLSLNLPLIPLVHTFPAIQSF